MLARRHFPRFLYLTVSLIFLYLFGLRHYTSRAAIALENSPNVPFVPAKVEESASPPSDLRLLCDQTTWTDGLWLHCHGNCGRAKGHEKSYCGGLNNIRNRLQTCIRLAIDTGAGLILATTATRDQARLKKLGAGKLVDASTYWDTVQLQASLEVQCPQLQLRFEGNLSGIETKLDAPKRHYLEPPMSVNGFRSLIDSVLATEKITNITPSSPVAVAFGDSFIGWDYTRSDELSTIRKDLFKTLNYSPYLMSIGQKILQSPHLQNGYIGVHLRGERDWPNSFGKLKHQIRQYINEMESLPRAEPGHLRTVYVSCGNQSAIEMFRARLEPLGYTVHDKMSLLASSPKMLAGVERLSFDERGAVEYQMLVNGDIFLGVVMSSMSSLIAYERSLGDRDDFFQTWIYPGSEKSGWRRTYPETPVMKGDHRTRLMVVSGDDIMGSFP